ncbi:MAG: HrpA-like RNA helicase, partial [Faunusvirus sp.]
MSHKLPVDQYDYVKGVVDKLFTRLNGAHKKMIYEHTDKIINVIAIKFCFTHNKQSISAFTNQLHQNNNRDILAIINLLLPYIDDRNNFELYKKITSFDDMFMDTQITNLQYNRCIRKLDDNDQVVAERRKFNDEYFYHNYYLLNNTIDTVANKLYINWVNVRPIILHNYKKTQLYKNSTRQFAAKKISWWNGQEISDRVVGDLYVGDMYNTMVNDLYMSIKSNKWLIYEVDIKGSAILFVHILNDIMPLDEIVAGNSYDNLSDDAKTDLEAKWNSFKNTIDTNSDFEQYSNSIIQRVLKYFILFFDYNYEFVDGLKKKKQFRSLRIPYMKKRNVKISGEDIIFGDDEDEGAELTVLEDITNVHLYNSIKDVPFSDIYSFIFDTINAIQTTWYGSVLFDDEKLRRPEDCYLFKHDMTKMLSKNPFNTLPTNHKYVVTPKNVYNFCKSTFFTQVLAKTQERITLPNKWISLQTVDKDAFCDKLNSDEHLLNITGNLRRIYPDLIKKDIDNLNALIGLAIKHNILDVIFETLIKKGVLSEFIPDPVLTDQTMDKSKFSENLKRRVFNAENKYEDAYYFLTNRQFKTLDPFITKSKPQPRDYFDVLPTDRLWFTYYAMDWLCQISFFHRYLNNRVMYVTGATGQGKSTQAPKLLLYALKMIDYNSKGKIICTQPRIAPTQENAMEIAEQMGVPLKMWSQRYQMDIDTDNTNIQYKYKTGKHVTKTQDYFLRIVTDGTLFLEVSTNPLFKKKKYMDKKSRDDDGNTYINSLTNLYDIVIIDEAHEHNKNMDLILTLMRNVLYYNNSVKLIIVSATIDDDEPIYRRYYRDINDNLMYPLNYSLKDYKLDRINVDRRYHISPPGQQTQHKVDDIYTIETTADTYENNANMAVDAIKRICETTPSGDILLFSIGAKEIGKLVVDINKLIPLNVICIPYFSEMASRWRQTVVKINDEIKNITIDKEYIIDAVKFENDSDLIKLPQVGKYTYNRAIIVATNVAEASITIPSLRFVVDTGFAKVNKYDVFLRRQELVVEKISESSRIQRRGRVGRSATGTVYYMYKKDARRDIKPEYKICNEDISDTLYKLLHNSYKESVIYAGGVYDPNTPKDININIIDVIKMTPINSKFNIENIILKQWYSYGNLVQYFGNYDHYDYNADNRVVNIPAEYYETGFNMMSLYDILGKNYIIHPNESDIKRELLTGRIISYTERSTKITREQSIVESKMINQYFIRIYRSLFIIDDNSIQFTYPLIGYTDKKTIFDKLVEVSNHVMKTEYGLKIDQLAQKLDFSHSTAKDDAIALVYSKLYNVNIDVLTIIVMLLNSREPLSLSSWMKLNIKEYPAVKEFISIYKSDSSDYITLLNIYKSFILTFPQYTTLIDLKSIDTNTFKTRRDEFMRTKSNFKNNKLTDLPANIDMTNYIFFNNLHIENSLNDANSINQFYENDSSFADTFGDFIKDNNSNIIRWCDINYINYDTLISFLKKLIRYIRKYDKLTEYIDWFVKNMIVDDVPDESNDLSESIIKSFVHSYGIDNIFIYDQPMSTSKSTQIYYNINPFMEESEKKYISIKKSGKIFETTVKHMPEYVMCHALTSNIDKSLELSIISAVQPKWFMKNVPQIYNPYLLGDANIQLKNKFNINDIEYLTRIPEPILNIYYNKLIQFLQSSTYTQQGGQQGGSSRSNNIIYIKIKPDKIYSKQFDKFREKIDNVDISAYKRIYLQLYRDKVVGVYMVA